MSPGSASRQTPGAALLALLALVATQTAGAPCPGISEYPCTNCQFDNGLRDWKQGWGGKTAVGLPYNGVQKGVSGTHSSPVTSYQLPPLIEQWGEIPTLCT